MQKMIFVAMVALGCGQSGSGKQSEAKVQLRSLETKVKAFHNAKQRMPASAPVMPGLAAGCDPMPAKLQSEWGMGWQEMGFHIDEPTYFSYSWTSENDSSGYAIAKRTCDGKTEEYRLDIKKVDGNLVATYTDP